MFSSQDKRVLLSVVLPIAGVIVISNSWLIPGFLHDFFYDKVLEFLVMYWVGLMFSNMYFYMTQNMKEDGASPRTIAITAGIVALVMLMAAGGPSAIWEAPWLVGIGVMPGIDIAWPFAKEWWMNKQSAPRAVVMPGDASTVVAPTRSPESLAEPSAEEPS